MTLDGVVHAINHQLSIGGRQVIEYQGGLRESGRSAGTCVDNQ